MNLKELSQKIGTPALYPVRVGNSTMTIPVMIVMVRQIYGRNDVEIAVAPDGTVRPEHGTLWVSSSSLEEMK